MFEKLKKIFTPATVPIVPKVKAEPTPKAAKPRKPKRVLTEKEIATKKGEPYIKVIDTQIDPANPRYGAFEMDWNPEFIRMLASHGYVGATEEKIVDQWFQDVCRHIVLETYEQDQANIGQAQSNVRYINRKPLDGGKSEIS